MVGESQYGEKLMSQTTLPLSEFPAFLREQGLAEATIRTYNEAAKHSLARFPGRIPSTDELRAYEAGISVPSRRLHRKAWGALRRFAAMKGLEISALPERKPTGRPRQKLADPVVVSAAEASAGAPDPEDGLFEPVIPDDLPLGKGGLSP
jgi:hypothetical protein